MGNSLNNPADTNNLAEAKRLAEIIALLPFQVNLWQAQNMYHALLQTSYLAFLAEAKDGEGGAARWIDLFAALGRLLHFNTETILPHA